MNWDTLKAELDATVRVLPAAEADDVGAVHDDGEERTYRQG